MKPQLLSRAINTVSLGRVKWGWWTSSRKSDDQPVIIGGCGRSGTTLLRAMLNAHKHINIGPETGLLSGNRDLTNLSYALNMSVAEIRREYQRSACLGEFVERVLRRGATLAGKERWGEKSPSNVKHLQKIFQFFPKARFIHMVRDGRDVVCSLRTHPKYRWQNGARIATGIINPWEMCAARWVRDTTAGMDWRGDARYLEVRYEDLVRHTEETIGRVLDFLGEDWDAQVLDYYRTHCERASDVANPGVKAPVYFGAIGRWERDMPLEAAQAFDSDAFALLVSLKYATDNTWVRATHRHESECGTRIASGQIVR